MGESRGDPQSILPACSFTKTLQNLGVVSSPGSHSPHGFQLPQNPLVTGWVVGTVSCGGGREGRAASSRTGAAWSLAREGGRPTPLPRCATGLEKAD